MNEKIMPLLEKFEAKGKERDQLLAKKDDFSQADLDRVKAINGEQEAIKNQIEAIKMAAELEGWRSSESPRLPVPTGQQERDLGTKTLGWTKGDEEAVGPLLSFTNWDDLLVGQLGIKAANAIHSKPYKDAFWQSLRGKELGPTARKDLEEGLDPQGGFTVPVEVLRRLIQRAPTPTRIGGLVTNIGAGSNAIEMPTVEGGDDTYPTSVRVKWVGEKTSASTHRVTDTDMFGKRRIDIHNMMLSIPLTLNLLEDSGFDLEAWVSARFMEARDLEVDRVILNGTGAGQPYGILTRAADGGATAPSDVVSGHASQLTTGGIIDLTQSLPEQYDENARLVYGKTTAGKAIRKLVDGQNRPIFTMGAQDFGYAGKRSPTVDGYPVTWSGFMPDVAANARPIVFGDLSAYVLAARIAFSIQVLREKYAEDGLVVLLGRARMGGDLVEPWKLRTQKVST